MIFNPQLPPAVLVTWIQLSCLAWSEWVTLPLSISELASVIGIHPTRLHKHLSQLQEISALSWRTTQDGKLILSFPEEPTFMTENQAVAPNLSGSTIPNSQDRETLDPSSYFPSQILGYLSYQEEQEVFSEYESSEDLEVDRVEGVPDLTDVWHCEIDQH